MDWLPNSRNLYRALLRFYPAEFRDEYGAQMDLAVLETLQRDPKARLFAMLLGDVLINAPREHLRIFSRDVRHSFRLFTKSPGFTATALAALALGIGAAVTIFSLIETVLLRSLPLGEPTQLIYFWTPLPRYKTLPREMGPSYPDLLAYRERSHSFSNITAFRLRMLTLNGGNDVSAVGVAIVMSNFFQTLEVAPLVGRTIDTSDEQGDDHVAVISYALWTTQFHRDLSALTQTIRLNGSSFRVVGVMPPEFVYPNEKDDRRAPAGLKRTDVWIADVVTPLLETDRLATCDAAIGRLRPGVTLPNAQAEMSAIQSTLDPLNLPEMRGTQSMLVPLVESVVGPVRPLMRLLAGAVIFVLLIACGNVANLLIARAAVRGHEMGVRTALGAPRSRLVRQVLTESLVLSGVGGSLGAILSFLALPILAKMNPGNIARFDELSIDWRVFFFAAAVSIGTGLLFGAFPAFTSSRASVTDLLREGGGRGVAGGGSLLRGALVIADIALAVVLLGGAGLLIRSYVAIQSEDKGFAESTLTMRLALDATGASSAQIETLRRSVLEGVTALPGVLAAGWSNVLPLSHADGSTTIVVEGYSNQPNQSVAWRRVAGDYFRAMQIPLIAGRYLTMDDIPSNGPPRAVVVSETFARVYFADRNPIGGHVRQNGANEWSTVVGIVADVRHSDLESVPAATYYQPAWDAGAGGLAIRTPLAPDTIVPAVRRVIRDAAAPFVLMNIESMKERTSEAAAPRRFQTVLLAAFAGIALFLALVGLYGLLAYMVRQRRAEIGVRMALGADRRRVIAMVLRDGLTITGAGLAIGLLAAAAVAKWSASLLYGVRPLDPITFGLVPVLVILVTMGACIVPAWRASRIDPATSLRQ